MSGADDAASAGDGQHDRRPSSSAGVEETLRDFWATRPRRTQRGRKVAGVAAGIGMRYGIDPILVRVAFAVTAFYGGTGILLYLLCWLLLPQDDDEVSPVEGLIGKGRSSTSSLLTVLLALALIPTSSGLMRGDVDAFVAAAFAAGALFLLHRYRGQRPVVPPAQAPAAAGSTRVEPAATGTTTAQATTSTVGESAESGSDPLPASAPDQPRPPSWDPLGVAPFAWDLPDPVPSTQPAGQPEPVPPRRRSRVTAATIGLALVVTGLGALFAPKIGWLTPLHVLGLVLAVLGLGLVAGLFRQGGRGLILLAFPLGLAAVGMTWMGGGHWNGAGTREWRPVSVQEVQSVYQITTGKVTLDLTGLAVTNGTPVSTEVQVGSGSVRVRVPRNTRVEARCSAGVGHVNCLDHQAGGTGAATQATADGSADRSTGGVIMLNVRVGAGNVEVVRG